MKKTAAIEKTSEQQHSEYSCEHCGRSFIRPTTLLKHLCEAKRRWDDRDRPANRVAFNAWLKFYSQFQPSKKAREYRDFVASAYYSGFMKFGIYSTETNILNPMNYVDWLLKSHIPLDKWSSDRNYTSYLIEYLQQEDVGDAIQRTIENMMILADEQNIKLNDVLAYVSVSKVCYYITCGKISPWFLYHSNSGQQFLGDLSQDHINVIHNYINPEAWNIRFRRYPELVDMATHIISRIGNL